MEKIDFLLEKLDYRIPTPLGKKIDKLDDLNNKLELAQEEFDSNPSDENEESLQEIKDYIEDFKQEVIEQLEDYYEKKKDYDAKAKEVEAQKKATESKKEEAPKETPKVEVIEEKKGGSGVLGLVIGAVLLVGSLGAINYFKNNR